MATFPELPAQLREFFPSTFWNWWQAFRTFVTTDFSTGGDFSALNSGKGIVLKNAAGTVTKRIRLNDLGDGIIIEDL